MSLAEDLTLLVEMAGLGGEALAIARSAVVRSTDSPPIVAVAGGTGSGKSSLVNRLAGGDVTQVGELRPTTSEVVAVLPPEAGDATGVLDRLGVLERSPTANGGPVLLDLPDLDSVVGGHRRLAEAAIAAADAVIWVLDPEKYADAVVHETMAAFDDIPSVVVLGHADRLSGPERLVVLDDVRRLVGDRPLHAVAVPSEGESAGVDELEAVISRMAATPLDHATAAVARNALEALGEPPDPAAGVSWADVEAAAAAAVHEAVAGSDERLRRAGRRQALMGRFEAPRELARTPDLDPPDRWDPDAPLPAAAMAGWDRAAADLADAAEHAQLLAARAAVRSPGWWPWARWGTLLASALLVGLAVGSVVVPGSVPIEWWVPVAGALVVLIGGFLALDRSGRAAGETSAASARADAGRLVAGTRTGAVVTAQREACARVDEVAEARLRVLELSGRSPMP